MAHKSMTTPSKPTPGPWRVGDAGATVFGPKRADGSLPERIANVRRKANARLIAAAPKTAAERDELREALERIAKHLDRPQSMSNAFVVKAWSIADTALERAGKGSK